MGERATMVQEDNVEQLLNSAKNATSVEEAIEEYNKALEINPNDIHILKSKIDAIWDFYEPYEDMDEDIINELLETANQALEIDRDDFNLWWDKVASIQALYSLEDLSEKAMKCFVEALEVSSYDTESLIKNIFTLDSELDISPLQFSYINEALKINPKDVLLLKHKSEFLFRNNRYDEALDTINECLKIEPANITLLKIKVKFLFDAKRNDEALNLLKSDKTKYSKSRFYEEGVRLLNGGDLRLDPIWNSISTGIHSYEALQYFDYASQIDPNNDEIIIKMGDAEFEFGRYGYAKQKYDKAIKIDNENAEAWYKKGLALEKKKKIEEAKECFNMVYKLDPNFKLESEPNPNGQIIPNKTGVQYPLLDMLLENKKQVILYGPPGTGKTYLAQQFIKSNGNKTRSKFVTFHQSYAYEEFIEGLRPQVDNSGNIRYQVNEGIFKQICRNSLNDLLETCEINKKWDGGEDVPEFSNEEIENIRQVFSNSDIPKYYLVIDEINRGDISRIFGELITALETDKRLFSDNEIIATLPYSNKTFAIPPNLYILGTMNTADKSIALIDIALRRRFSFLEMMPDYNMLERELNSDSSEIQEIYKLGISALRTINESIEQNYDRDHVIGHSYLLKLKGAESKSDALKKLKYLFYYEIIPLLQEYYYDSPTNLQSVIGKKFVELRGRSFKINDKLSDSEFFNELCNLEG